MSVDYWHIKSGIDCRISLFSWICCALFLKEFDKKLVCCLFVIELATLLMPSTISSFTVCAHTLLKISSEGMRIWSLSVSGKQINLWDRWNLKSCCGRKYDIGEWCIRDLIKQELILQSCGTVVIWQPFVARKWNILKWKKSFANTKERSGSLGVWYKPKYTS